MANTWGALTWNQGVWGDTSSTSVEVTGLSVTTSISPAGFAGAGEGWGRPAWNTGAWGITGDVFAQGQGLTSSLGSVTAEGLVEIGWGRGGWGNRAWGDTFSAQATGQTATLSIGNASPSIDVSVSVSGLDLLTITQGLNSIQIDSSIFVFVGEDTKFSTINCRVSCYSRIVNRFCWKYSCWIKIRSSGYRDTSFINIRINKFTTIN